MRSPIIMADIVTWTNPSRRQQISLNPRLHSRNLRPWRASRDHGRHSARDCPRDGRGAREEEDREPCGYRKPAAKRLLSNWCGGISTAFSLWWVAFFAIPGRRGIAQQVFLKAYLGEEIRPAAALRPGFTDCRERCSDYLRKKKVRPLLYEADFSEEQFRGSMASRPTSGHGESERAHRSAAGSRINVLGALSGKTGLPDLRGIEGFSGQELAPILGLNVNHEKCRCFVREAGL